MASVNRVRADGEATDVVADAAEARVGIGR
jgi:hypothetical protein